MQLVPYRSALGIFKTFSVFNFVPRLAFSLNFALKLSVMSDSRTAYFHLMDGSEKFTVRFLYWNESLHVNRQFNFERSTQESIHSFLARVTANLEKIVLKKVNKKLKKSESSTNNELQDFKVVVELHENGINISDTASCKDTFFSKNFHPGNLKLKLIGLDYNLVINAPWVDSLTLPSSIMAGFPVYPNCFESKFTDKSLSKFVWKKSIESKVVKTDTKTPAVNIQTWIFVGEGFIYIPSVDDIGSKLKLECTPKNSTLEGPPFHHESKTVVEAGPGSCPFEVRHLYSETKTSEGSFRVVSYNILADIYSSTETAQNELFSYCPSYALNIDYRKQLFLKELLGYNADLICLQEVDGKVFEADLVPVLGEQGLIGIHSKKATVSEGVSCFYSSSKFKLLEVQEIVLSQELIDKDYCSHIRDRVFQNDQLKERITRLGTTAQAIVLESLEVPGEIVVMGNTHLYFHPDADHIRLVQGGIVMAFLANLMDCIKQKFPQRSVSLLCCGDFNSVPECGIYRLMTTKFVPEDFVDWKSKPEEEVKGLSLSQPFSMASACGTPEYTNYTVGFAGCLDYIYYQTDRLNVDAVVPFPSGDELREHRAIPSVVFPSDHVALVATLQWKK